MMNKSKTIYEYKDSDIDAKYIPYLIKINKIYSKTSNEEDSIFKIYGNKVRAKQFVGVIRIKNLTIQILPKLLSSDSTKTNNSSIIQNLLFMLKYTKKLDIKETDFTNLKKHKDLFEVMIYLFAKNLLELLKFDLYKNYELQEDNLNYLKGKLKLKEHIKYNYINKSKFYCEYDEFIEDNLLNKIFKKTIVKLMKITRSNDNYKLLISCDSILNNVTLKKINYNDLTKVKFTRFNKMYKSSFNLAKLLLFGNSIELSSGNINTFSMLFDMNKLFEEFIGEFIKQNFKNEFYTKTQKSNQYVFNNKPNQKFSKYQLKPDIYIKFKNNYIKFKNKILIIDTKYKKLDKSKDNYKVSQSDIYQMIMYGLRYFGDKYNTEKKEIILLYPKYDFDVNGENINLVTKENIVIKIRTVNLNINLKKEKYKLKEELEKIIEI